MRLVSSNCSLVPSPAVGVLVGSACAGYEPGGIPIITRPSAHPRLVGWSSILPRLEPCIFSRPLLPSLTPGLPIKN
ncbi:hypothetical protein BDQ94DRAFT_145825 [Aspergillus welwitschiae]|uniref:Uncharacterized protein n=1 Tax=Aspergillus welwitschiae TaxID=1341132 RepID=A0A3F3PZB6_9EURO|nr:hypothetical protein BDQ94DRAFT_145825 [Aspergillus welwitschiae]RDH32294.1 hypothetical protein BDQ94DRAFT_145825 [Aspergillus welwitschiae]